MNQAKQIVAEVDRHAKAMKDVVQQLKDHILSLPDNHRIRRVKGNPHCFTMSFSDLGKNYSVEHHDFKKQYEMIVAELEKCQPDGIINRLLAIITDGRLNAKSEDFRYRQNLHPDVIAHLVTLLGCRWQSVATWPKGTIPSSDDISTDLHDSREAAAAVTRGLAKLGLGGEGKIFPEQVAVKAVIV